MRDPSWWYVLICLTLVAAAIRVAMFSRLKALDPEIWRQLDEPTLFNGNLTRYTLEAKFLLRARYWGLRDPRLSALAITYSILCLTLWLGFAVLVTLDWIA